MKILGNKKCFTLVEVLIATAILVSLFAALVYGFSQCSQVAETARNSDIALNIAQEELEDLANSDSISTGTNPIYLTGTELNGVGSATVTEIPGTALYDVTATVTWVQRGQKMLSREVRTTLIQK